MDNVDRDLEKAEQAASPDRFPDTYFPDGTPMNEKRIGEKPPSIERQHTASTGSSASTASGIIREEMRVSRTNTQRDLERHPTELGRIETHRTQHSGTVGRTITSRKSKKPLPNFGAGKDYPPQLPAKEDYVVEFDGIDDPMHPQNWAMRKKCVYSLAYECGGRLTRCAGS
jgi:DHA1 family multidrug resistance protein-like MFS transporter